MTSIAMGLGLWVPDEARDEIERLENAETDIDVAAAFRRRLRAVDARLDIIWVKRGATSFPVPGRWYITRQSEDGAASAFWVVQTEGGHYTPPTDQHFDALMARDTWGHPDVRRRILATQAEEKAAAQKKMEDSRREFREKLLEQLEFNNRVQVPAGGVIPVSGRRLGAR